MAGEQDWHVLLAVVQTNCNRVFMDNKCNSSEKKNVRFSVSKKRPNATQGPHKQQAALCITQGWAVGWAAAVGVGALGGTPPGPLFMKHKETTPKDHRKLVPKFSRFALATRLVILF